MGDPKRFTVAVPLITPNLKNLAVNTVPNTFDPECSWKTVRDALPYTRALELLRKGGEYPMDYLKLIVVGNTTNDAEVKQAATGSKYADFTLAYSKADKQPIYFPVRVFGKIAQNCGNVKKGDKVLVEGSIEVSEYQGKEGEKRVSVRILADTYRKL